MEETVEKIKSVEAEAAKIVAKAETDGKKMLYEKQQEIEQMRTALEDEIKKLIANARDNGENDAKNEIENITIAAEEKIAKMNENFLRVRDELIKKIMEEFL